MITRIVKMKFAPDKTETFTEMFNEIAPTIRSFQGCRDLKLIRDQKDPSIFFTWSVWDGTEDLNQYRNSDFFANTWEKTKAMFDAKPEAWTVEEM